MPAAVTKNWALDELRYIPLSYDSADSETSALRICLTLYPEWKESEGPIEFIHFKDGITNTLLKAIKKRPNVSDEQIDSEAVLLRAYGSGTEILIDRQRELTAHSLLAQHDLAPPLVARFQNGLAYQFVRGHVCSPKDLTTEPVWRAVARRLAQWHALLPIAAAEGAAILKDNIEISLGSSPPSSMAPREVINAITPRKPTPNTWTVMSKWIHALPTTTPVEIERKDMLQRELKRTAAELVDTPGLGGNGLVFAHCDLLSGNVIVQPSKNVQRSDGSMSEESVDFIDYEYATPSPAAFDLANHFSEWGGFDCDYSALPTRSVRKAFIQEYVQSYNKCNKLWEHCEEYYVVRLLEEVDRFRGIPGLYWGIWALIQTTISQIDFDYASYAQTRLKEYWDWRATQGSLPGNGHKEPSLRERRWAEE